MQTLTYGYKKPQTGDPSSIWMPAFEDNTQRVNDHNHAGTNSTRLTTVAVVALTTAVLSGSWVAFGDPGTYRQLVTMPGGLSFDECAPVVKDTATGQPLWLTLTKVSATTFYVYINDNSKNLTVAYVS
jgi:hypothetical protein